MWYSCYNVYCLLVHKPTIMEIYLLVVKVTERTFAAGASGATTTAGTAAQIKKLLVLLDVLFVAGRAAGISSKTS